MRAANRAEGKRLRKKKEDKRKKKQQKLQAWERGEDIDSDDDDEDGDDDKVVDDIEWDDLENEDVLTGIGSSLQESGPFPFHGGEGMSGEPVEMGLTIGLPQGPTGVGGSAVAPEVPVEVGGPAIVPYRRNMVGSLPRGMPKVVDYRQTGVQASTNPENTSLRCPQTISS